jgi:hypothetical protein
MENGLLNATVSVCENTCSEIKFRAANKFFSNAHLH